MKAHIYDINQNVIKQNRKCHYMILIKYSGFFEFFLLSFFETFADDILSLNLNF